VDFGYFHDSQLGDARDSIEFLWIVGLGSDFKN
jgi:hypothetical protein